MELYLEGAKKDLFIKTIIWNSLIKYFKEEKEIDISDYLVSVKIINQKIIIRTNKPILNSEAILGQKKIYLLIENSFKKVGIDFSDYEIFYK